MRQDREQFKEHLKDVITQLELEFAPKDETKVSIRNLTKIKRLVIDMEEEIKNLKKEKNKLKAEVKTLTGKLIEKDLELTKSCINLDTRLDIKG